MLISLNGVWLTNNGTQDERAISSCGEVALNGKQLVQDGQFLRAVAALPIARGNKTNTLTFKVSRNFALLFPAAPNPIALAASFLLSHFSALPTNGPLVILCGGPGETPIEIDAASAVLEGTPQASFTGVSVDFTYTIRCGLLAGATAPASILYDGGVEPVDDTNPSIVMIDGGNAADTYINLPTFDGGVG